MRTSGDSSIAWWFSGRGWLRILLTMTAIGLGGFAALTVLEVPLAPWLRSFGVWPTLAGDWHGKLEMPDGRVSPVYLRIGGSVLDLGARGTGRSDIRGSARWCDARGSIRDYDIWGNPDNWRGTRFHLSTRSRLERDSGETIDNLQGEWSGDEIRAVGRLVSLARTATATATRTSRPAAPPQVRYTLRRGNESEFLQACGAVK
jgi:hypothetical protein